MYRCVDDGRVAAMACPMGSSRYVNRRGGGQDGWLISEHGRQIYAGVWADSIEK
jgi:hypothetical protein